MTSHRASLILIASVTAGAVAFMTFVFFPTTRRIRQVRDEIGVKQQFINDTDALLPTISQMERDLAEVEQYARQWQDRTPAPPQLANLFGQMTAQARQCGAVPVHFEPKPEVSLAMLHRIPVRMEVTGSFSQVCCLLAALEAMPQPFWVDQVDITRSTTAQDVQGGLSLEVFASHSKKSD